ncbi:MAG: PqqD family protein [Bacteroidetes bacterium]|nr:PqqD family protein [Bacteroidota bacterium]
MMIINRNIAISETGFVFNPINGESFSVNPIGYEVISLMKENKQADEIMQYLLANYQVEPETCRKDLEDFMGMLKHHLLLEDKE